LGEIALATGNAMFEGVESGEGDGGEFEKRMSDVGQSDVVGFRVRVDLGGDGVAIRRASSESEVGGGGGGCDCGCGGCDDCE
jgi:hypothetical protein